MTAGFQVFAALVDGSHPGEVVKADCVYLQGKHPEMFPFPEDVRATLDWVFTRPDAAYRAQGGKDHVSILRRGPNNHHAVIDFGSASGQYRVKRLALMNDAQLAQHLGSSKVCWSRHA